MKTRLIYGFCLTVLLSAGSGSVRGGASPGSPNGAPFVLNFDENGNGFISVNGGAFTPSPGVLLPDPSPGDTHPPVLTYFLPEIVWGGDVGIVEPASDGGGLSDGLRFTDATGNRAAGFHADRMIYYSDTTDAGVDLADTGFPVAGFNPSNTFSVNEVGAEGNNGFTYIANNGGTYNGISDGSAPPVPEIDPGSMAGALTVLTGGVLALRGRRRPN